MKVLFSNGKSEGKLGRFQLIHLSDGWYLVGYGYLCQVDTKEEGAELVKKLNATQKEE